MIARLCAAFDAEARRKGLDVAVAVALAYLAATTTGLPERLWAVMTALIVMRPTAESTLVAGLNRALGTAVGALFGLAGVAFSSRGWTADLGDLAIVALLAYASGAANVLRAAPIGALIVLSAAGAGGQFATGLATLRLLQVVLGAVVAVAVGVVTARTRGEARARAGCARLVRGLSRLLAAAAAAPSTAKAPPIDATEAALTRLGGLASDADRVALWLRRGSSSHAGAGALVASTRRLAQDVQVLSRLIAAAARRNPDGAAGNVAAAAMRSLDRAALALERGAAGDGGENAVEPGALAAPLRLLQGDADRLVMLAGAPHS
jgi:uncharacterized membrane protein YccC